MAFTDATMIQQWVAYLASQNLDYHELNRLNAGAAKAGFDLASAGMAPLRRDEVESKILSLDNIPFIPVIKKDGVAFSSSRQPVGSVVALGETDKIGITRHVIEAAIAVVPDRFRGNAVGLVDYFNKQMGVASQGIMSMIDTIAVAALEAGKTQVGPNTPLFTFDALADTYQIVNPAGVTDPAKIMEKPWFFIEQLGTIQKGAKLTQPFNLVVGSPGMESVFQYSKRFADYNAENIAQLAAKKLWYNSSAISETSKLGSGFALAPYSFGLYTWNSGDARARFSNGAVEITTQFNPMLGFDVDLTIERGVPDLTAVFGAEYGRVVREVYRMTVEVFALTAYSSAPTTVAAPVVKFDWTQGV
jgi:hypothetical protein